MAMACRWPLLVALVLQVHFTWIATGQRMRDVDLQEVDTLMDPFVYAASNSHDWSSRITPTTTPNPVQSKPAKKKAASRNYQSYQSSTPPETSRKPLRRKKVTTTVAPETYNQGSYSAPYNTPTYPTNQYQTSYNQPQTYSAPTERNIPYTQPYTSTDRGSLFPKRKPVYEQNAPESTATKPNYRPTDYEQPQPQYTTAFPTPNPPNKRVVVVRRKQKPEGYGTGQTFNYAPAQSSRSRVTPVPPQPSQVFTPIPAQRPNRAHYDHEIDRYAEIRDQILGATDAEPSHSRQESFFEPPKFEIPKGLNEKGCKMVIKEVQELPKDLHARGSDLLESFFRSKRSPVENRRVKSIIMTKECYYPDGTPSGSAQTPQIDPKFFDFNPGPSGSNNNRRVSKNYQASQDRPKYHPTSTQRYDSSPYYDYPNEGSRQESSYDDQRYSAEPQGRQGHGASTQGYRQTNEPQRPYHKQAEERQLSRPKQTKEEPLPQKPSGGYGYSTSVGPNIKPDYDGPSDYRDASPSQSKFESDPFGEDYGGFDFESGFSGEPRQRSNAGSRPSASNRHRQGPKPTPKMYQKTFQYYKKDNGKENDPNNNSNAEEYATGYFKHYSSDYDSDRDGPQNKQKKN